MTAAHRLKGLGWLASVTVVTLGFYLVSLQVAAERKRLDGVNRQIAFAQRDIRALETEFDTRANLAQLERWNGDTLALVAPTAGQFVRDEAQLAAISFNGAQPGAGDAKVQTAQLVVPSLSGYDPATGMAPAAPIAAPVVAMAVSAPAQPSVKSTVPVVLQVAKVEHAPSDRPVVTKVAATTRPAAAALRKAQAMAMLDRNLLSDSTLGDLMSGARAERRNR